MSHKNFSNIYVNGESLENHIIKKEAESISEYLQEKYFPKRRTKIYYPEERERSGKVHQFTRTEIHLENLPKYIQSINPKDLYKHRKIIIALLLASDKPLSIKDIVSSEYCLCSYKNIAAVIERTRKASKLGRFILKNRKSIFSEERERRVQQNVYSLTDAAKMQTFENLCVLAELSEDRNPKDLKEEILEEAIGNTSSNTPEEESPKKNIILENQNAPLKAIVIEISPNGSISMSLQF